MVMKLARSLSVLCKEYELCKTYTCALTSAVKMQ